MPLKVFL